MILVIVEHLQGKFNKASLEAMAAAQAIASQLNHPVEALCLGGGGFAAEIPVAKLHVAEHASLERYTADGYSAAARQAVEKLNPWLVLLPHTYQVRDFVPKLAASMGRAFVSDATGFKVENGELLFQRQLFAGKIYCDVAFAGKAPFFASVQAGAFRAAESTAAQQVEKLEISLDSTKIRQAPEDWFQEAKRSVDLSQAEIIVSV